MPTTKPTPKFAARQDCSIDRDHQDYPASAVLLDEEGTVLRRFDEDWTDAQILDALDFANYVFGKGIKYGEMSKAHEIRQALNINLQLPGI